MNITDVEVREIEMHAIEIRESIITMLLEAGSGHTAGPLGMADVFATLYFKILNHNPTNPFWKNRDRVILSNGHICPVLYATMAHAGYFNIAELLTLRKFGSRLQGHPHREFLSMLETSSGPLGSGLSQAVGMALADRLDRKTKAGSQGIGAHQHKYFYCFMGDGELDEGQNWEAFMLLAKQKLHNVICIIDRNRIQIDGDTEDVMPLDPLSHKLDKFNLSVVEIDGHDIRQIVQAFLIAKKNIKPTVIIANTIPGKGFVRAENDYRWHGKPPTQKDADEAFDNMRTMYGRLSNN
ncbi:MAG: Transketolase N-terminal domain protein [Patescibacteria group bacterium]|nr:Transketolase N-terminal domain protein [Patescibacteria group bacterium]